MAAGTMRCMAGLAVFATLGAGAGAVALTASDDAEGRPAPQRERVRATATFLSLGRARLNVVSRHPRGVRWGGRPVRWYLGAGRRGPLRSIRVGRTREARPGVTRMTATVRLPRAGPFRFAACFAGPRQNRLGHGDSHGPCGRARFRGPARSPYVGAGLAPAGTRTTPPGSPPAVT